MLKILDGWLNRKVGLDSILKGLLFCGWLVLFISGITLYPGSWIMYTMFSVVFLALLLSGFSWQLSYGYLFLVVFLWLGFWLKLTLHQLFVYPFVEPVGQFDYSAGAWDQVLLVAIVGAFGVLVARIIYGFLCCKSTMVNSNHSVAPEWYEPSRIFLWGGFLVLLVGLAASNIIFGIQQSGLVPRTILMWPLNAVVYWALGNGLAMCLATMLWWEVVLRKNVSLIAYAILVEASFSTVSLLSRGLFVFHAIPSMFGLYINRASIPQITRKKVFVYVIVFTGSMLVSLSMVNTLRGYYYSNVPPVFLEFSSGNFLTNSAKTFRKFSFVVDRWVGVEGVMAISAYPDKGVKLFGEAIVETSEIGKSTHYQEVCLAHYRLMDMNKFQFASLPGAIAFFFYSKSLLVVMCGMTAFTLLLLFSEKLVSILTSNPLLSSFWGCAMANVIAQFGVTPRGLGPYFLMNTFAVLMIWGIQSSYFAMGLRKIGLFKRH